MATAFPGRPRNGWRRGARFYLPANWGAARTTCAAQPVTLGVTAIVRSGPDLHPGGYIHGRELKYYVACGPCIGCASYGRGGGVELGGLRGIWAQVVLTVTGKSTAGKR